MQAKQEPLECTVYPAMSKPHAHKFFIQESLLGDLQMNMMVCGICGYSTTKVYVD